MATNYNKEKLYATVVGAAVADAVGVPYEFKVRDTFRCEDMVGYGTHHQPAGTWSDDTAMMLATADSIRRCKGAIDADDIAQAFQDWFNEGAYTPDGEVFDYGITVSEALRTGHGCTGEYSNGNGSLMRIAPLAFTDATDDEIRAVSAITHAHKISCEACVRFVRLLRQAAQDPIRVKADLTGRFADTNRSDIDSGGFVLATEKAALWCFATTDSYRDCVLTAVNLGRDTDTTACVAGALAGLVYGIEGIDEKWLSTMRGMEVLESCLF